jgi:hypothetical protein
VLLTRAANAESRSIRTDVLGEFEAASLAPGLFSLVAQKDGLISDRVTDVPVRAGETTGELRLVLIPGGALEATVRDAAIGNVVDSCVVVASGQAHPCDHGGIARIAPLTQGDLPLRVTAPGYAAQELTIGIPGRTRVRVDIQLVRGATISGVVLDPNHRPLAGAHVVSAHYALEAPRPVEVDTVSGADGRFVLDCVVPGLVGVRASAPAYAEAVAKETALGPGATRTGVELVLNTGGAIIGTVSTLAGLPAPGARVQATRLSDHSQAGSDLSGADGSFRLDGLTEGDYTVTAEAQGGHGVVPGVKVTSREESTVKIILGDDAVDGIVHDPQGTPIAGAAVTAYSSYGSGLAAESAVTGRDGRFQISGLVGAPYRVQAIARDCGTAEVRGVVAGAHVDLELQASGRIAGVVRAPGGHSADNFDVKIVPKAGDRGASLAGRYRAVRIASPDGAFRFDDVPAGAYDVVGSAHGRSDGHASVSVSPGETVDVTLTLGEGATISGRVLQHGVPMTGCVVGDGAVSDSSGSYEWTGVSDGDIGVSAHCPDGSEGRGRVHVEAGAQVTQDVEVQSSGSGSDSGHHEDFGGVGASLRPAQDGNIAVNSVFEGGPAFMAGLEPGDEIVAVNGQAISGNSIDSVVQSIRGPIGTPVVISVQRAGSDGAFDVYVERDRILVN